jgi:DNA (cytosine-5)-methyltransferase 1
MRLLDLFCGAGGAARGYHDAGFEEIVGVDTNPKMLRSYPFECHEADAMTFPLDGFDVIHASPPCQGYSATRHFTRRHYPKLIPAVRARLEQNGALWVIENVVGAPLVDPIVLCGSSFGLGLPGEELRRHRLFESSVSLVAPPCGHRLRVVGVYGHGRQGCRDRANCEDHCRGHGLGADEARLAMAIDWMNRDQLREAIPPAYTEWIGRQLIAYWEDP